MHIHTLRIHINVIAPYPYRIKLTLLLKKIKSLILIKAAFIIKNTVKGQYCGILLKFKIAVFH